MKKELGLRAFLPVRGLELAGRLQTHWRWAGSGVVLQGSHDFLSLGAFGSYHLGEDLEVGLLSYLGLGDSFASSPGGGCVLVYSIVDVERECVCLGGECGKVRLDVLKACFLVFLYFAVGSI